MIRLIATDIDGTLTDSAGGVPPANRQALSAAAADGIEVVLVTVRMRVSAQRYAREMGIRCAMVCEGGAVVHEIDGAALRTLAIPRAAAEAVACAADAARIGVLTTVDGHHHAGPGYQYLLPGAGPRAVLHPDNVSALNGDVTRMIFADHALADRLRSEMGGAGVVLHDHHRADGSYLDTVVTHAGATKETGLAVLLDRRGVAWENVLAIGDSASDARMLQLAGVGVAMGQAHAHVRAAAGHVAPSADDAGLAWAVGHFTGEGADSAAADTGAA